MAQRLSLRQLIWACLGLMTAVFLVVSAVSIVGRVTVARAIAELTRDVVPVQSDVEALRRAYTDQETGQRGFMLTGNPVSLEPYTEGIAAADRLIPELRAKVADDPIAIARLDSTVTLAGAWRTEAAEPQIAARRAGGIPPDRQTAMALEGKRLFDELRRQLRALAEYAGEMGQAQLQRISSAQTTADTIQVAGAAVLALVVIGALVAVRRCLTRPVNVLLREVKTVADGGYDQPIHRAGPHEIAQLSEAVEQMRESLRASTERLVDAELRDEQARIAADLHGRVIQRVFGLGLAITSASARRKPELQPLISETDAIIRDLREVVFNLDQAVPQLGQPTRIRAAIIDTLENSAAALGFTPTVHLDGPLDEAPIRPAVVAAVLAVIRESLSNVARHAEATDATLSVVATQTDLSILLEDNGIGLPDDDDRARGGGHHKIRLHAHRLGGYARMYNAGSDGGAVLEWVVPIGDGSVGAAARATGTRC